MSLKNTSIRLLSYLFAPVRLTLGNLFRNCLYKAYHRKKILQHDDRRTEMGSFILEPLHKLLVGDRLIPDTFRIWNDQLQFRSRGSIMSTQAYYTGEVEYHLTNFLKRLVHDNFGFLDVGGHHGAFSCIVAHLLNKNGWTGQILTFEPDPGNRAFINENLRSNSLESQIRLIPFAVSDTTGLKRMIMSDEDNSANTLVFDEGINYGKQYQVVEMQTVRLDDFYQDLENVSAIKMDIQGGEYWALLGAERIISEFHPVLILEVVESWGKNISEIEKFLSDHDYEVFGLDRKSKLCKLRSKDVYVSWDWIAIPRTRLNSFKDCIAAN